MYTFMRLLVTIKSHVFVNNIHLKFMGVETPEAAHPYRPLAGYSFQKMVADDVI